MAPVAQGGSTRAAKHGIERPNRPPDIGRGNGDARRTSGIGSQRGTQTDGGHGNAEIRHRSGAVGSRGMGHRPAVPPTETTVVSYRLSRCQSSAAPASVSTTEAAIAGTKIANVMRIQPPNTLIPNPKRRPHPSPNRQKRTTDTAVSVGSYNAGFRAPPGVSKRVVLLPKPRLSQRLSRADTTPTTEIRPPRAVRWRAK